MYMFPGVSRMIREVSHVYVFAIFSNGGHLGFLT